MHLSFLVVDDFYPDPHEVRKRALELDYPVQPPPNIYHGRNSKGKVLFREVDDIVSRLVNEPVKGAMKTPHGNFRIGLAGDDEAATSDIHVDNAVYWSGIIYLTLPEHCQGGTHLYRHRKLGTDQAPIFESDYKPLGYNSSFEASEEILADSSKDPDQWELLTTIPMRFNRLILLRPWLWHAPGNSFGDKPENGRLVHLLFFNRA
ncbi:DUF6445 family protein [Oceanibacterium hippocampi]|uniref:Phytanoyl-CoA dioxygenase (PhyH) n=1 Tax=Oceanibacterium hippocampi TaxID=745714 RepID=A0A1Y5TCU2_9PROT|nr:DUF6445 family protein [Oceanibacterium hippocampi]SLN58912.1 hypothetical protein OCH7691_02595 [Oceanibacterium hippocampi]